MTVRRCFHGSITDMSDFCHSCVHLFTVGRGPSEHVCDAEALYIITSNAQHVQTTL